MTKTEIGFGAALIAGALIAAALALPAHAADKMTDAQCLDVWNTIDISKAGTVAMNKAQPYATDMTAVDTNRDGMVTKWEFAQGCAEGVVRSDAVSGASEGTAGKSAKTAGPNSSNSDAVGAGGAPMGATPGAPGGATAPAR